MALAGDVQQLHRLEVLLLKARERGLGVGQIKILSPRHQHVAAVLLGHRQDFLIGQVARRIDFLLRIEGGGVEVGAHEAQRAGEHVGIRHTQHGGHTGTAAEAGDIHAAIIHGE